MTGRRVAAARALLTAVASAALVSACATTTSGAGQRPASPAATTTGTPATATPTVTRAPTPARKPRPKSNPCAHNAAAQLVKVSLRKQHLWMCARKHLAYSTPITSGIVGEYTSTPTGDYSIQGLDRNTVLTLLSGDQYTVNYWIPFDGPLFGFHDSSWQDFPYGSPKYKTQGSHGCVHMPLKAIAYLYRWADVGAEVKIRA